MIKVIKRKNPNLKGEEFIDDTFITWLFDAVLYNSTSGFQKALTYRNISESLCNDCEKTFHRCKCEDYADDYYLPVGYSPITTPEMIDAVKKQFEYLSKSHLIKFRDKLANVNYNRSTYPLQEPDNIKLIKYINNVISKRK